MSIKSSYIILPENSFWKVFKRFGRDEVISLIFNIIGTIIIAHIVKFHINGSFGFKTFIIAIGGPVVEKVGFYPYHLWTGFVHYKKGFDTLKNSLKIAIKNGSVSMLEDIIIHDPVYFGLMWGGLYVYTGTPEWMLAFLSFVLAVIIVSFFEVGIIELWYKKFKHSLRNFFHSEKYYESRFKVATDSINPIEFIEKMSNKFDLSSHKFYEYTDKYWKPRLMNFNGREGKVRERVIECGDNNTSRFEITYTKAGEIPQNILTQYRFFINQKEKFSTNADTYNVKNYEKYYDKNVFNSIHFHRHSIKKTDGLYVAIDTIIKEDNQYSVIELKVFNDLELIKTAMEYVMSELNVVQTTLGKIDI